MGGGHRKSSVIPGLFFLFLFHFPQNSFFSVELVHLCVGPDISQFFFDTAKPIGYICYTGGNPLTFFERFFTINRYIMNGVIQRSGRIYQCFLFPVSGQGCCDNIHFATDRIDSGFNFFHLIRKYCLQVTALTAGTVETSLHALNSSSIKTFNIFRKFPGQRSSHSFYKQRKGIFCNAFEFRVDGRLMFSTSNSINDML